MTEQEIKALVIDSAKLRKRSIKGLDPAIAYITGRQEGKCEIPDYYENYREMVMQYKHIEYHADGEIFPEDLFAKRSPNISPDEENYVRENYKNNTQTAYLDFVNQFSRIFHDSNWDMDFGKEKNPFKDYLTYGIMEFGSLLNYMKSVACSLKILDPNGVIAVKPMKFDLVFNEEGEQVVNEDGTAKLENKELEPQPVYYRIEQIVGQEFGNYYLILTDEKSLVKFGNKEIKAGLVYEFYDKDSIWKISQFGKPEDFTFDIKLYLNHGWGYIPVFKFKGVAKVKNGSIFYVSPFYFATHCLDACLLNGANLQTSTDNCAYPYRIMMGDECEFEKAGQDGQIDHCVEGEIFDSVSGKNISCPSCNGTGLKSRLSPLGVMLLKSNGSTTPGDNITASNAMAFVAPDPAILIFLREQIATDYEKAREVLHLRSKQATTTGPNPKATDPTATADVLDQKAQDSFTKPQSDQMFEMIDNIAEAMEWQRYGREKTFTLTPPKTFDFMSQQDYLNDISNKKAAGLPPAIINASIQQFIDGTYSSESDKGKALNLIVMTDRIISLNSDDIALLLSKNLIAPWEEILHESADYFIQNLMVEHIPTSEKPTFFDLSIEDQKTALMDAAKTKAAELKPITSTAQTVLDIVA